MLSSNFLAEILRAFNMLMYIMNPRERGSSISEDYNSADPFLGG